MMKYSLEDDVRHVGPLSLNSIPFVPNKLTKMNRHYFAGDDLKFLLDFAQAL